MDFFPEQAHTFATRRPDHERVQANIARRVDEIGDAAAALAAEFIVQGATDVALDVMFDCLAEQCKHAKIRHLEVVRPVAS